MRNGSFEVSKLETGFLIRVCLPENKEEMYNGTPCMAYQPPKEGAVASTGEVLGLMSQWLEKGDVDFGTKEDKKEEMKTTLLGNMHDSYGQEPKVIRG